MTKITKKEMNEVMRRVNIAINGRTEIIVAWIRAKDKPIKAITDTRGLKRTIRNLLELMVDEQTKGENE
jgi:hypothetical protein